MEDTLLIILAIVNIPVYVGIGWVMFRDLEDFWECIRFWFKPDILSAFNGEYFDDWWAELKLGIWGAACVAAVFAEHHLIESIFGG